MLTRQFFIFFLFIFSLMRKIYFSFRLFSLCVWIYSRKKNHHHTPFPQGRPQQSFFLSARLDIDSREVSFLIRHHSVFFFFFGLKRKIRRIRKLKLFIRRKHVNRGRDDCEEKESRKSSNSKARIRKKSSFRDSSLVLYSSRRSFFYIFYESQRRKM